MSWDPGQYLRYADHRLRPAVELLARVQLDAPDVVVDLGCGPGNVTDMLSQRWPGADVLAIDNSAEMLDQARQRGCSERVQWLEADGQTWEPDTPVDLVWANAALHWLDDHAELVPRLVSWLRPGGRLAVQMPRNFGEPSHTLAYETAQDPEWSETLEPLLRPHPVAEPASYHALLAPLTEHLDVWETVYFHGLDGQDAVFEWTRGSLLRPLLAAIDDDQRERFEERYRERLARAYPPREDGTTLFPFRRLFIVAAV